MLQSVQTVESVVHNYINYPSPIGEMDSSMGVAHSHFIYEMADAFTSNMVLMDYPMAIGTHR